MLICFYIKINLNCSIILFATLIKYPTTTIDFLNTTYVQFIFSSYNNKITAKIGCVVATENINGNGDMILYGGDLKGPLCRQNVGQYFLDYMLQYGNLIGIIDPIKKLQYTYNEIRILSIRCALEMRARGIGKGDIVTICARNHINTTIPILSAVYLGATVNPLHPNYSYNELFRMINITEPRLIVCDEKVEDTIRRIRFQLGLTTQVVTFENGFEKFIQFRNNGNDEFEAKFKATEVDIENDNIFIMCTSGTTGLIKGVTIKHAAYYSTLVEYGCYTDPNDKILTFAPFCWITGIWSLGVPIFKGILKVLTDFDPDRLFEILRDYQISWLTLNPFAIITMIRSSWFPEVVSNLKCVMFGGVLVTDEQFLEFQKHIPNVFLHNLYGSTEMHFVHAYFDRKKDCEFIKRKINSNGYPPPGIYWKIVDPETNQPVGYNKRGELWIKGPTLTKGYYKDPIATANAIDKDGFYHTGDLVRVDEDNCLYVVGRLKDLLKYKGWQVSPIELEKLILGHWAVQQVCVMGKPDPVDGDWPLAFIVKKPGCDHVSKADIINYVAKHGSDAQKLRGGVHFLDQMPMTVSGKIKKSELTKLIPDVTDK